MWRDLGLGGKRVLTVTCGSSALTRVPGSPPRQEAPEVEAVFGPGGRLCLPAFPAGAWAVGGVGWGLHTGQDVGPV